MAWLAGVNGCRLGWFRASRETVTGELAFHAIEVAADLVRLPPRPQIVALDIPIGLPERGARRCDVAARAVLGPRRSSVFPAPIRPALAARSHAEASEITSRVDGRRVAAQAWAIYRKVAAVDQAMTSCPELRKAAREVHPEVSFWAWNQRTPMAWHKRKREGLRERLALIEPWLGAGVMERAKSGFARRDVGVDDVLDAIAALWTAQRIADGLAETLPELPERDAVGLPMEIVY